MRATDRGRQKLGGFKKRQGFALAAATGVKHCWTWTLNLCKIKKIYHQGGSRPQDITSGIVRPDEDAIHPQGGIIYPEQGTIRPEEDIVHLKENIVHSEQGILPPEDGNFHSEEGIVTHKETFIKDISIFSTGSIDDFEPRRCLLDSGSRGLQGNLISKRALNGIRCEVRTDAGREICGLGLCKFLLKEFVRLRFRFWDRLKKDEIFEVEFRVLPTRTFANFDFPGFDCLLGSEWMDAHPRSWVPRRWVQELEQAATKGL